MHGSRILEYGTCSPSPCGLNEGTSAFVSDEFKSNGHKGQGYELPITFVLPRSIVLATLPQGKRGQNKLGCSFLPIASEVRKPRVRERIAGEAGSLRPVWA